MLSSALGFAGKAKRAGQEVEVAGKDVTLLRPQHEEEAKAEEGGPPKDDDELLGGGKKMPVLTAMQKRWITHFRGRPRLLAWLLLLFATGAMLMLAGLWTQCFFPSVFNSRLAQELVLNAEDKWSGHWTYQSFLEDSGSPTSRLFSVYLFNVTNPAQVMAGYKPIVQEAGPYAYVRHTRRYSVTFSPDDSQFVSYKTWEVLQPSTDTADCRELFFRMGHSAYSPTKTDCKGQTCHCKQDHDKVTMVNPRFFRLLAQHSPSGVLARLSQSYFEASDRLFSQAFVSSVRAFYSSSVLPAVYRYRRWQHAASTLADVYDYMTIATGTPAAAQALFQADHSTSQLSCPSAFQVPGEAWCTWGTAKYVYQGFSGQTSNYSALSSTEASNLLDTSLWGSLLHSPASLDLWVSAARHLGVVPQLPLSKTRDKQGYRELLRVFCAWGGYGVGSQVCAGKVKGLALYLHAWAGAPNTLNRTLTEWALGTENVACDTDDSRCHWPIRQGAGAGGGPGRAALLEAAAVGVSNETGRAVLEAKSGGKTAANRLSVLDRDNLNDWATAARYCARLATDSPANCSRLSAARQLATDTLPRALHANGSSSQGVANLTRVACGLALYLMEGWAGANNSFMDRALSAYLNSLSLGHTFNESAMEDVGYLQWGSGAVTYALKAVRSTFNLQGALWTAAWPSCYRINGPLEFSAHAARAGYPGMTLSVSEAKLLLRSLANDTDQGQALRRKLISSITTYRGDGINSLRGLLSPSQRAFTTHAVTPDFFADMDGSGFSVDRTMQPHYNISLVLNQTYASSGSACSQLQSWYTACEQLISLGDDEVSGCTIWETIATDPSFGLVCSSSLINDELGDHPHPWPRTVGHSLFAMMRSLTWECVVEDGRLACPDSYASDSPTSCDYAHGGPFVSGSVRDLLFGGYSDPFTDRLVNLLELRPRGLSLACLDAPTAQWSDDCDALPSLQCGAGYQVSHRDHGPLLNVSRPSANGTLYGQWFEPSWALPMGLGSVDSPVAGVYLGKLVDNNSSFHKARGCDPRYLNGPGQRFQSCVTRMQSGQRRLGSAQVLDRYLGNATIGPSSTARLQPVSVGSDGRQFSPSLYDGFRNFSFPYKGLYYGQAALGPESVAFVHGPEALAMALTRVPEDLHNKFYLQYPTRYAYRYNATQVAYIQLNRYREDEATWSALQSLVGESSLSDHLGMAYTPPLGLFPTDELSGLPSFVGSPHLLANKLWASTGEYKDVTGLSPEASKHRTAFDVEPISGRALRSAKRMQVSVRMERSSLLYDVVSSARRCPVPTATYSKLGYGCFAYVPLLWYDDQDVATLEQALHFVRTYQATPDLVYQVGSVGLGLACFFYALAALLLLREWRKYVEFKKRVFIDY